MHGFGKLIAAAVMLGFGGFVQAGLLPVNVTVTPDGDNFRYSYGVVLTSDSTLRTGDFFTIYDFEGLVPNSNSQPAGFTFTTSPTGPTPAGTSPSDSPLIGNITWVYTGPDTLVGQAGLGNFMVQSTYGSSTDGVFTSHTHRQSDGKPDANITETAVPVPTAAPQVPEPATLLMLVMAMPLLGMVWLKRRNGIAIRWNTNETGRAFRPSRCIFENDDYSSSETVCRSSRMYIGRPLPFGKVIEGSTPMAW